MDIEEDDEKYSPDLYSTPRRDDSEGSWTASSQDREQDQIKHNLSKDMMFLVSLGSLMSLFTYVYFCLKSYHTLHIIFCAMRNDSL